MVGRGVVGRAAESAALDAFLDGVLGGPATLVLEGQAGIGKSTLLAEAAATAAGRGFRVLASVAAPAEVRYAYTAVADLLSGIDADVMEELPAEQRAALDRVLLGAADGPASDERMVATAFLAVIRRLCSVAPVLLCIDDAQWLDTSSQMVIGFAERRLTGRVGALVVVRIESGDATDLSWLHPTRPGAVERLRIAPLTLGGVHTLVSSRLKLSLPRPSITRIHEISGGNPLFALELARYIAADPGRAAGGLPDVLAAVVRDRIGSPGDDVAAVLLAVACVAQPSVEQVSLAVCISPGQVAELAESEQAAGVLEIEGNRIRFRHPLFANGVYSSAGPAKRRAMHRRFAEIVDEPELRARHLALAATTGDPEMLEALDDAAMVTRARGAPAVAAELIELAIKLGGDSPTRRMRAAEQYFRAGEIVQARLHLHSVLADLPSANPLRCMALIMLAGVTGFDQSLVAAAELLGQAVDEAGEYPVLQLRARLLLVPLTGLIGDMKGSVELADIAVAQAEQLDIPALRSQALTIRVVVQTMYGLGVDWHFLQLALDLEDLEDQATATFHASSVAPVIYAWCGELDASRQKLNAVYQRFLEQGTEIDILWAADFVAIVALWSGRLTEAVEIAAECTQRAEQMGGQTLLIQAWGTQAMITAYTGDEVATRKAACAVIEATRVTGGVHQVGPAVAALGFLEVSLGDFAAAVSVLEPLLVSFDPVHGTEIVVGAFLPDEVEALTALGRLDEAEPLFVALEINGARLDRPWMLAVGARGRAHWLAARGELEAAERAAVEALVHHQRLPMPFETARTQLLLGQVQRRRRRRRAAEVTLREALTVFEGLGAPLWARRARDELDRVRVSAAGGGLTAAERRVAERAARGLSNKQIAAELFIAPKTVEMTLSSVYRKLGIRSRAGLFAALNPDGVEANH